MINYFQTQNVNENFNLMDLVQNLLEFRGEMCQCISNTFFVRKLNRIDIKIKLPLLAYARRLYFFL